MINNKRDLRLYLEADRIALNIQRATLKSRVKQLLFPNNILAFQRLLRRCEYFRNTKSKSILKNILYVFLKLRYRKLSIKLGFSIPENVFGPGLAIVHYGTIIVNAEARIGKNCRIHACTNIGQSGGKSGAPVIGDNVYIGPGVKIYGDISLANNIAIAANAAVGKSFNEESIMIGGVPATKIKDINIKSIIKHL